MSDSSGSGKTPPPFPPRPNGPAQQLKLPPRPKPRLPPPAKLSPPAVAPRRKSLAEILSDATFLNLVRAMHLIFSSCPSLDHKLLSMDGEGIAYGGRPVAFPSNDSISIPLSALGDELKMYGCLRGRICSGELKAPSLSGLKSVPNGLFMHVSSEGFEFSYPKPAQPEPAPQGSASAGPEPVHVEFAPAGRETGCGASAEAPAGPKKNYGKASAAVSAIESIDARLEGKVQPCEENGESRIYFSDLGWDGDRVEKCKAFRARMGIAHSREYDGRIIFMCTSDEVFISCTENSVSLCGAKARNANPSISVPCAERGG